MTAPIKPSHSDIYEMLGELKGTLEEVKGSVARIDAKVHEHDRLAAMIRGGFIAVSVSLVVLWWLTKEKLAAVFGVNA